MKPSVSINIVTWNSMRFLPKLLNSISEQTFENFSVLVIDNGSTDGVEAFVKTEYPNCKFLRNARNRGFSYAHNQGIRFVLDHCREESYNDNFILITNPDVILTPTFLEELVSGIGIEKKIGSFGGKILRAFGSNQSDGVFDNTVRSDMIDSTGINAHKNMTFTDRGAGELDEGQFNRNEQVFGISGALVLYRASALHNARYKDEFFDKDFFSYKEDVDLAWRLKTLGWNAMYNSNAVAYHFRGMFGKEKMSLFEKFLNRLKKSKVRSKYSTRNHLLLLIKNLRFTTFLLFAPRIILNELLRFVYVLIFETKNIGAYIESILLTPKIILKRMDLMKKKMITIKDLHKWFI